MSYGDFDIKFIMETMRRKRTIAQSEVAVWDPSKYVWIIGLAVYNTIRSSMHTTYGYMPDDTCTLFDIKVETIDTVNLDRITLYKEVGK